MMLARNAVRHQIATLAGLCLAVPCARAQVAAMPAAAIPSSSVTVEPVAAFATAAAMQPMQTMHMVAGRSLVLHTARPLKRIFIGNPELLQSYNSGPTEVVLTAKTPGQSTVVLWDQANQSYLYTVAADDDPAALTNTLREAFPEADFLLESHEGRLFLTGTVSTDAMLDAMGKLAASYNKNVVNGLRVLPKHGRQVQLKLRIVEVDRAKAEQFGVNLLGNGRTAGISSTGQFPSATTLTPATQTTPASVLTTDPLNFFLYNFKFGLGANIKDLETKQILQILAEPTLTTLSGLPARFLSGGEFPVPVVQGGVGTSNAVTIVYRPYGVKVDFTPQVNPDGTIHLKIAPEVSALDYTNSVTVSGTTVPALSTRRAETEVEIKDGQSFVLSGLLDHRTTDSFSKTPGIASVPILGQLFKSKNVNHSVLELMVIVTASVVDPLADKAGVQQPEMAVPNMEKDDFDRSLTPSVRRPLAKPGAAPVSEKLPAKKQPTMLQVAALPKEDEASRMVGPLKRLGYNAQVQREKEDALYHVRVGPFPDRATAVSRQQELRDAGYNVSVQ